MALFKNMTMTYKGMALYAKSQAGQEIHFSKLQVGSGEIGTQDPATLIKLVNSKFDIPITSITPYPELKNCIITGNITNKDVTEATYICEIGLFAIDPDDGEILYGYCSSGTYGDYYAPASQGAFNWEYNIAAAVGNAANITAQIVAINYDYSLTNTNKTFVRLTGGNQKEINKSIDTFIDQIFKDIATQKADIESLNKIKENVIILTTGWVKDATTNLYKYKITDSDITADTIVDVNIKVADLEKAEDFKPSNESFNGYIEIYSESVPTSSITCDLKITKQVVV